MVLAKYCFLLLKRRPPRDISSQETTSSGMPGRRMHAWYFTLVRACLRRSSGRAGACGAAGVAVLDAEGAGVADCDDGCSAGVSALGANRAGGGAAENGPA